MFWHIHYTVNEYSPDSDAQAMLKKAQKYVIVLYLDWRGGFPSPH